MSVDASGPRPDVSGGGVLASLGTRTGPSLKADWKLRAAGKYFWIAANGETGSSVCACGCKTR